MRYIIPIALTLATLAGCAATPPAREVRPVPVVTPAPRPSPAPSPLASDWNDWPFTAGDWRYYRAPDGSSTASFGIGDATMLGVVCDRLHRKVGLAVTGSSPSPATIRATTMTRTLSVLVRSAADVIPPSTAAAFIDPNDSLLDAIAFSRGRFVVEQPGQAPLVLPPHAEIGRVIEDCRG